MLPSVEIVGASTLRESLGVATDGPRWGDRRDRRTTVGGSGLHFRIGREGRRWRRFFASLFRNGYAPAVPLRPVLDLHADSAEKCSSPAELIRERVGLLWPSRPPL